MPTVRAPLQMALDARRYGGKICTMRPHSFCSRRRVRPHLAVLPLLLALLLIPAPGARAQTGARRALTPDDWDRWRSIVGTTVSADGQWVAYSLVPQVGDGELIVRSTRGATEWRVPRGFIGRPQLVAGFQGDSTAAPVPPAFSPDSRWVIAQTSLPRTAYEAAMRRSRRTPPKSGLAIVSVADGKAIDVARVRSFKVPREGASVVAYLLEPDDTTAARTPRDSSAPAPQSAAAPGGAPRPVSDSASRARRREFGSTLVLRDLNTGRETRVPDVLTYVFDDSARWLGYTVASRTPSHDGAYARRVSQPDAEVPLLTGAGDYRALALDRAGTQAAFTSNTGEFGKEHPRSALYHARLGAGAAQPIVAATAMGDGMVIADSRVAFTRSGGTVLFGYTSAPLDSIPADSLADKAVFDLWHWKDTRLQPQQRVEAARDRTRSFGAVYQIASA
ncbi:MAG: peptidase family protein, partial [Gemmatimonadetes bacterium]|nr:peptidase family protein [Gemmatimonadota bacterium]